MKKVLGFLMAMAVFGMVGIASANTYDWSNTWSPDPSIGIGNTFTFNVPITDPAFVVPPDVINAATLTITTDVLGTGWETVKVQAQKVGNDFFFAYGDLTKSFNIAAELTPWGPPVPDQFTVSITNNALACMYLDSASFHLDYTTPEPGTLLLFGSGLVGLAGWRLRKRS